MQPFRLARNLAALGTVALAVVLASAATAATPVPPGQAAAPPARADSAPVLVDGETLFHVRGTTALPARKRAGEISQRIQAIAADPSIAPAAVRVVEAGDRSNILAGERLVLTVVDADAQLEQVDRRQIVAETNAAKIAHAIGEYRRERGGEYLRGQAVHAALALAVLAALLAATWWAFRQLERLVDRRFEAHLRLVEEKSHHIVSLEQVRHAWHGTLRAARMLLGFVLAFACAAYLLTLFPWTRYAGRRAAALLLDPLATLWEGLVDALPGLAFIAVLVVLTRYVLRLVQLFFAGVSRGTIKFASFEQDWSWPTYRLLRLAIIAFTLVIAYPYIPGSDSEGFKGVSIFIGVLMSLGASGLVANSLAGYALLYRRAFKVGDRIKVEGVVGDVVEIRQQATHLRTPKNEEVTIPSAKILGSEVVNYSSLARDRGLILHTTVGIGYDTPWRQVEAMLLEAARRAEGLLREPSPFVLQKELGEFNVTYELNVYCDQPQEMGRLYSRLHQSILDVFNEYGVQIMTPSYEGDPESPKVVPQAQWFAPPAKKKD